MRFGVLGPLEVSGEDGPLPLGGPKQRTVLAHLVLRANQVVPAEHLIDAVWGEEPPEAARGTLQAYVSRLRSVLGSNAIEGRAPGYRLRADPEEVDALRFERLLREARGTTVGARAAAQRLTEALELWRGSALADLVDEPSLSGEIARLEELRIQATEERIAAELDLGYHAQAVADLENLIRQHPLRERLWGELMIALYRSGRQSDALSAFRRLRTVLADELGIDPSRELLLLHERILRQDPDLELRGEPLRGYQLLEQIGDGAFGVVYRAIQPQVGREVAIKAVHPELANHPDFVRRFEREAQIIARLEHPHIVPLYDYWREPDAAYLVMRFLRGGSLEDLLGAGPLEPSRAASILDQVATALAAAHRQGVVHRDVKPGNVLLDEEGNAYLTDFGVALDAGSPEKSSGTMTRGTPAYLSPEQIRLDPATPQSDVYALGVVLYQMLTGEHPFPETSLTALLDRHLRDPFPSVRGVRSELPPAVDHVIARATAKDSKDRSSDVLEVAAAFRAALEGTRPVTEPIGELRNPYKGLRAFLEADAGDFFGREAVTQRLIRRFGEDDPASRFLAVVGPSGSGKSSVVRAGFVPALRRGALPGSDRWYVIDLLPGPHPLREIESALLGVAVEPPPSLLEELERDELGLVRAVDRVLPDPHGELVIVVDQLEEVFTLVQDEDERSLVLACLRAAALEPGSRVRIVATLRADFFDQPLSVRGFGDLLGARTEAIAPMSPEELERAIVAPADRAGLVVEPRLLAAMIADVADRPGALPLLQYALTELAERADGGVLSLDAYRGMGGVSGALARRAEQLFEHLNESARDACRQLFLRSVTLGLGTEATRRRVRRSELLTLADARAMDGVIETFGRHRLLSFDRDPDTREPTVEIAHEALLGEWARLRDWIEVSREELRLHARISAAATEWVQAGRGPDYLLTGSRLAQAAEEMGSASVRLTDTERQYVDASLARRETETEVERARQARERRLERRALRRLRGLVAVLAAAMLVAASLTAVAVNRTREAERRRDEATVAGLTGAVLSNLETDPDLSLLLALHAVDLSSALGEPVPAETVEALHWALQWGRVQYPVRDGPTALVSSPSGLRGIFDLPVSDLANLAREHVTRPLTSGQCERYFGTSVCPSLPKAFPAGIASEPIREAPRPAQPLAGTSVSIMGVEDPGLLRELNRAGTKTGIDIRPFFTAERFVESLRADPPDIFVGTLAGLIAQLAREGRLMDLGTYLDVDQMRKDYSPYLLSLGTVAPDGSWPSDHGNLYGGMVAVNLKSLVWYPVPEFHRAGYAAPETWDELVALSKRMVADGRTPWCMGLGGDFGAWSATDWIENLVLGGAGRHVYDRWTFHQIPFDHPAVRRAFERLGQIVFEDGNLFLGVGGVLSTPPDTAQVPMVQADPPECWLYHYPSFAGSGLPPGSVGSNTDAFRFPASSLRHANVLLGGGGIAVAFADRPEVREVMRFLLSPEFGQDWFTTGEGFFSPNRRFDPANYDPPWRDQAELLEAALAADTFRFDGSDLMPPDVGGAFFDAMERYLAEGTGSLDEIVGDLEEAWPDG